LSRAITRLMVANRGEIARRVFRSCKKLGIETVAVFSDPDRDLPFVREADVAVRLGPAAASESYLNVPKLLDAAKRAGADAIHPGYGFLAENAAFAQACEDAGLVWVGPTPKSISAMGKKREAKEIARNAGVPVIPGYDGADQDPKVLAREAERVGFPVLLKPSAGGGGKGMRIVRQASELEAAIAGSKREAQSSFGDDTLLVEKYVERPRHIEIQILGDQHGNLAHLYERECSVQRRHQKIVEESPSTAVSEELREKIGNAALALGKAIAYESAGTVEFILAPDGAFYFLEVNTRIQVEHPVTEELLGGIDLVEEQVRVACGEVRKLASLPRSGAVIERVPSSEREALGLLVRSERRRPHRVGGRARLGSLDPLRPDAREDHRARARSHRGDPQAPERARARVGAGPRDQPRLLDRGARRRGLPRGRDPHPLRRRSLRRVDAAGALGVGRARCDRDRALRAHAPRRRSDRPEGQRRLPLRSPERKDHRPARRVSRERRRDRGRVPSARRRRVRCARG
jgi:biotin carboxylase